MFSILLLRPSHAALFLAMALMVTDEEAHLLCPADFPSHFVACGHVGDYIPVTVCIPPTVLAHRKAHHNRLFLRICFKTAAGLFVPITFIADTGSPSSLYVGASARAALEAAGRFNNDEADSEFIVMGTLGKATVQDIPLPHAPANIAGLPLLVKLGLCLDGAAPRIRDDIQYL